MSADDPTPPSGTPRTIVARSSNAKILAAETVGTCVLMLVGPGSAIVAVDAIGVLGVSLAFGFALLAMAYSIGHLSGCHINPAVTLGFLLTRKVTIVQSGFHWVGQVEVTTLLVPQAFLDRLVRTHSALAEDLGNAIDMRRRQVIDAMTATHAAPQPQLLPELKQVA